LSEPSAYRRAREAAEDILADVREVLVNNESEANALRFIGSPSVRVNGKDVEPLAFARTGLSCRISDTAAMV
jgi:protein-disulfide isomerase